MKKQNNGWIIVDFDCWHGCNNPEVTPGCDESPIRIRINREMDDKFSLFEKYMEMPCPRCSKIGKQKRSGWWVVDSADTKLKDYDNSMFLPSEIQDYTGQMLLSKLIKLATEIQASKKHMKCLREKLKDITETTYTPWNKEEMTWQSGQN